MTLEILLAAASVGFFLLAVGMFALALCEAASRGDRMAERARRDVTARSQHDAFGAWDADVDLPSFERHAGGWRR